MRMTRIPTALAATSLAAVALTAAAPGAQAARPAPEPVLPTQTLPLAGADDGAKLEGIGVDQRRGTYYVSETTGGEIHRGTLRGGSSEWLGGNGTDGRWTARGVTTDRAGNVYVAGGPNGIDHPGAPDVWVYSPEGELLTALRMPGSDTFVNDVTIGPDGAAYFTDSNDPRIFRVAQGENGWGAEVFADGSGVVQRQAGFNLGGIVTSTDRSALVVAQGNAGLLWRVDLGTGEFTPVEGGTGLKDADGLVRNGTELTVIRNFERRVTSLRLSPDGSAATLFSDRATDPTRVLTTAKVLNGQLLAVDSRFDEPTPVGDPEVVVLPRR